jgi:hypothetical protein
MQCRDFPTAGMIPPMAGRSSAPVARNSPLERHSQMSRGLAAPLTIPGCWRVRAVRSGSNVEGAQSVATARRAATVRESGARRRACGMTVHEIRHARRADESCQTRDSTVRRVACWCENPFSHPRPGESLLRRGATDAIHEINATARNEPDCRHHPADGD